MNHPAWRDRARLTRTYRALGRRCGCRTNNGFRRYAVNLVQRHPATWGWYVGDEAKRSELSRVRRLSQRVRRLDRTHPRLYIAYEDIHSRGRNLRPFARVAEYVGADTYPVGTDRPLREVGVVAAAVRRIARARRRKTALVLQSFSWHRYLPELVPDARWPTRREMRSMRDQALRRGRPDLVLWFSYHDVARDGSASRRWRDLRTAAFARHP